MVVGRPVVVVVTMGCGERVPAVDGLNCEDWPVEDPKGQDLERVRDIQGEVRAQVEALIAREALG